MSVPILATKLYVPPAQREAVPRPRLIERLDEGLPRRLTLVSAAAGFGKTTLLSEWVAGSGRPAAWLSLDDGDSDPARFMAYLVAALQTIDVGEGVLGMLDTPQLPPTEAILTALLNEILQRQPERIRSFLLQTSILDRLSGPLCDAVTDQEESGALLGTLERGNLFIIPLDDTRHWFRYHHLFADVLQAHLMAEQPDQVLTLHRRASEWFEHNGSAADAIRHALAAEDFGRAADLVELAVPAMRRSRQEATLLGWLQALPDELFHARPVLSVHYAGTSLQSGQLDGVEARLRDAARWMDVSERAEGPSAEMVVRDEEEFRRLPGSVAMYRAGIALVRGDVPGTVKHAQRALDLAAENDHILRGAAAALLGLASWTNGDLEAADRPYADGMAHLRRAGNISDAVGGALALADIRIAQGRLRDAMRTYEIALQLATEHADPTMRGTADMYVGMSELHREYDDLEAATQHLLKCKEQGEHTGFP